MDELRSHFLLDPTVTFLNHGSFGATPREVLEVYHDWQRRLESQPVKFLGRELPDLLRGARRALGRYLQADPDNLVFIPNATFGVNVIARTFNFQPGEELLTSDQEYGACENVWHYIGQRSGLKMVQRVIPLPLPPDDEIVDIIWSGVTKQTRLIFLSHITSPTAVRLPVEQICQRARKAGILTLIDGAHAPGQIELNLTDLGADFYTGNCHKWLMAPKGSAFLHIRPEHQDTIQPLVVSWGWGENCSYPSDSHLQAVLEWWGTKDPAAYLSVPEAIQFQTVHQWDDVREKCRKLLEETLEKIQRITGLPSLYGTEENRFCQVGAAFLPADSKPDTLQAWLYDKHRIEIPVIHWRDQWLIRPSVQGYNTEEDLEFLVEALGKYLKK
ncbi:MAG: aminotransferase class V-fold PLP-dependent enzyme [Anaerolineales bacterium]